MAPDLLERGYYDPYTRRVPFALFIVVGLVFAAISIVVAVNRARLIRTAWSTAATQLGLDFDPGTGAMSMPAMGGMVESFPVLVDVVVTGSGDNRKRVTRYRVTYPPLGMNLHLSRQIPFLSELMGMFGSQDIEIGDQAFDDMITVQGREEAVRAFLNPVRRNTIARLFTNFPGIEVHDDQIELKENRVSVDSQQLVSRVRRLAGAARQLAGAAAFSEVTNAALRRREEGDLADLVGELEAADRSPDLKLAQAEIASALGERAQARAIVDELAGDLPADPEVSAWRAHLDAPSPAVSEAPRSLEAHAVAADLFGDEEMSFEIDRNFIERYRGRDIRWLGDVKAESHYAGGVRLEGRMRVTVTVASLESNLYGTRDFDAVVEVPASISEKLHRGDRVEISGRMDALDALMRNVFLEDAELVEL